MSLCSEEAGQAILQAIYHLALVQRDKDGRRFEVDDYVDEGMEGFTLSALKYDPSKGASFRTYIVYRAHGKIRELKEEYWRWRRLKGNSSSKTTYGGKRIKYEMYHTGLTPKRYYIPEEVDNGVFHNTRNFPQIFRQLPRDERLHPIQDPCDPWIRDRVNALPGRDGEIIRMLYNGWTARQVADHYGISEGRLSQLKPRLRKICKRIGLLEAA